MKKISRLLFIYATALSVVACNHESTSGRNGGVSGNQNTASAGSYDQAALLSSMAANVIFPIYQEAAMTATAMRDAVSDYLDDSNAANSGTATTRLTAQATWRTAMNAWQQAEVMQIGPLARSSDDPGGENLRDEIYSWPTINACRVDQVLVARSYESTTFFSDNLVNVYGFDALEYLLFSESSENACAPQAMINSDGSWNALSDDELTKRRASYALVLATEIALQTTNLVQRWSQEGGNYLSFLAAPDSQGSPYRDTVEALNAVMAGLFYVELVVKDDKIAFPAGIEPACGAAACPGDVESPWARTSKEHVVANLRAFKWAFTGEEGSGGNVGFEDALISVGADELATAILLDLDDAIAEFEAVPGTFYAALTSNDAALDAAYDALKKVTDQLKGQFVTVLTLQVPSEGAGDAD